MPWGKPSKNKKTRQRQYRSYLKSLTWKGKRRKAMKYAKGRCQLCGALAREVHHMNYRSRGKEQPEDLIALCRKCHKDLHTR